MKCEVITSGITEINKSENIKYAFTLYKLMDMKPVDPRDQPGRSGGCER